MTGLAHAQFVSVLAGSGQPRVNHIDLVVRVFIESR